MLASDDGPERERERKYLRLFEERGVLGPLDRSWTTCQTFPMA